MRITIVTDAWPPHINGVVTTLARTARCLRDVGHEVRTVSPEGFRTRPCPTCPEIRLALRPGPRLDRLLGETGPDTIQIATQGPLGVAARRYRLHRGFACRTSYHTQFPQDVGRRAPIPAARFVGYKLGADLDRGTCRASATSRTRERTTRQFLGHLVEGRTGRDLGARAARRSRRRLNRSGARTARRCLRMVRARPSRRDAERVLRLARQLLHTFRAGSAGTSRLTAPPFAHLDRRPLLPPTPP